MTHDDHSRARRALCLPFLIGAAAFLGGCAIYNPQNVSAMSTVDLCELRDVQGRNLTQQSRRAIDEEIGRRKDNCGNHVAEVSQRREAFMYQEMYGKQSP